MHKVRVKVHRTFQADVYLLTAWTIKVFDGSIEMRLLCCIPDGLTIECLNYMIDGYRGHHIKRGMRYKVKFVRIYSLKVGRCFPVIDLILDNHGILCAYNTESYFGKQDALKK
ncbi:hypothetical protein NPIL_355211 [Nephila pilipes]|uniref:Uncharacterized protein n=1 Tax=Nephila pilipes TaxID=299642 RepID=A0A8X6NBW5_NEPPI|nr:hypothetical protein NPIL_355211 [Nephila pilipes]